MIGQCIALARWQIRREGQETWHPIEVPGCWEEAGWPADDPGPFVYRTAVDIPATFAGRRIWLRFGAVSYDCTVLVDGREVGRHTGAWDAFEIEITGVATAGRPAEITVHVEKPASPTAGPDSPTVPGRFPLRQTLAGFLPYVWGHAFGGLWQEVTLFSTGPRRLLDVQLQALADGHTSIAGRCSDAGPVSIAIDDPDGRALVRDTVEALPDFDWRGCLPHPRPWSPDSPVLYVVRLSLPGSDERLVRFGFRTVAADGSTVMLNGRPIYPRLALSWGWSPDRRCPDPGPERVRARLSALRDMGFNGVKLCLWFPPPYYFDLTDELGMLLWVELPMWLPDPSPHFCAQVPLEYERLVRAACCHPSVVIYTLGCELNRAVGASFLADLYGRLKALAGQALVRDNSGSGEAYGGWLAESADFYDHHFYCDLQFLRSLLVTFAPYWRSRLPWLMGEFGDYDTLRDWPALLAANGGHPPWWADPDPRINPQGARWEMRVTGQIERGGHGDRWEAQFDLHSAAYRQGLLHRKVTLETIRAQPEVSGYVITGEVDTPISTAGLWDDLGRQKFEPAAFRAFNDDLVLLLGSDRARDWVAGGDRPAFRDRYSAKSGETARTHLIVSNYACAGPAHLDWQVGFPGEAPLAAGEAGVELKHGRVAELGVIEFIAPATVYPRRLALGVRVWADDRTWINTWPIWVYPRDPWQDLAPFTLFDPGGLLPDLPRLLPLLCQVRLPAERLDGNRVIVCTAWSPRIARCVAAGGRAILIQPRLGPPGPLPVIECPYWREVVKIAVPHPAWGDFPHEGEPGLQFYGMAPDCALDTAKAPGKLSPLLRRMDARGLELSDYAAVVTWGQGLLIATTLRLQGGLGDQPTGISRNRAALYLLTCWLRYLGGNQPPAFS